MVAVVTQSSPVILQTSSLIPVSCPNCGDAFLVPQLYLGKRGRCKGCQTLFTLPSESQVLAQIVGQQSLNRVAAHLTPSEPIPMATAVTQPVSVPPPVMQHVSANDDCWSGEASRPEWRQHSRGAGSGLGTFPAKLLMRVVVLLAIAVGGLVIAYNNFWSFEAKARQVVNEYMLQNYGVVEGYDVDIDPHPVDLPGHMSPILMAEVTLSDELIAQHHANDTITRIQFYFRYKRPYDFMRVARFGGTRMPREWYIDSALRNE